MTRPALSPLRPAPAAHPRDFGILTWCAVCALALGPTVACRPPASRTEAELHARARAALARAEAARSETSPALDPTVEAAYAELLRVAPRAPGASSELGRYLARCGDGARAEPLLRHALSLAPGDPGALRELGLLLHAKGEIQQAEARLARAVEVGATDHATRRALADSVARLGAQPARAAEAYLAAVAAAPEARARADDLVEAARAFVTAGDIARARDALHAALVAAPRHAQATAELERLGG